MTLAAAQPTSVDALGVMALGLALFLAALAFRRHSGLAPVRSPRAVAGIAVQMLGFLAVVLGPIVASLAPDSALAIGEAAAVALLMAATIGLFLASARALARGWTARTREDHQLVTWGPFAAMRHPIYTALFALLLALALALGHWRGLLLGVPLYGIGTWMRIAEEERLLRARFGAAYDAYAARVKRFVPGLF